MEVSVALGTTKVEYEGGRVVWDTDSELGVETVRDAGEGGGEEDKVVGASGVNGRGCAEVLAAGKSEENWWDCDTEGRGKGGPEEGESPTDPALASRRTEVYDILRVGVKDKGLAVRRPRGSVES